MLHSDGHHSSADRQMDTLAHILASSGSDTRQAVGRAELRVSGPFLISHIPECQLEAFGPVGGAPPSGWQVSEKLLGPVYPLIGYRCFLKELPE